MEQICDKNKIHFFKGYYLTFPDLMFNDFLIGNNNYFHSVVKPMCFLKTLKPLDEIQFDKDTSTDDSSFQQISTPSQHSQSFLNQLLTAKTPILLTRQDQLLQSLMTCINSNNIFLANITQKLQQNEQKLISSHEELSGLTEEHLAPLDHLQASNCPVGESDGDDQQSASHPLLAQLFGAHKYQYRLQLQQEFPPTIFKERNINISINLVDKNSQKVLNSNIVHLCLGVCDENGHWITENKAGEDFMKGKTEVEMYHGEGSFLKVYPRDVSRSHPNGKVHFVVYPKPSTLRFSSSSNVVEKVVESNEIEPLLISDVTIKAKKS